MSRDKTTIEVTADAWSGLNQLKGPGDSFDNVIRRLLELAGANIEPPEDDDAYVAGNVVLARRESNGDTVLRPTLKIRDKRASEPGDYEVADFSDLKWGSDSTEPRARGYIQGSNNTFNLNNDKVVELTKVGPLNESE